MAPADPEDGVFDVTIIGHATRRGLVRLLPGLRTGKHLTHPAVRTLRARTVTLTGNSWPAYADGEPQGSVPVTVSCVPSALTVLA